MKKMKRARAGIIIGQRIDQPSAWWYTGDHQHGEGTIIVASRIKKFFAS
jgi:hypothetical protein